MSSLTWRMPASRRSIRSSIGVQVLRPARRTRRRVPRSRSAAEVAGHDPAGGPVDPLQPASASSGSGSGRRAGPARRMSADAEQDRGAHHAAAVCTRSWMSRPTSSAIAGVDRRRPWPRRGATWAAWRPSSCTSTWKRDEAVARRARRRASRSRLPASERAERVDQQDRSRAGSARPPSARRRAACSAGDAAGRAYWSSSHADLLVDRLARPGRSMKRALTSRRSARMMRGRQAEQAEIGQRQPEGRAA